MGIDHLLGKVHNCDCLEFMNQLPNNCVDISITSPPYNMGVKSCKKRKDIGYKFYSGYCDNLPEEEYLIFIKDRITRLIRISKHYVFWNMQMLSHNKDIIINILTKFSPHLKDIFIWEKQAISQVRDGKMARGYEFCFIFGKNNSTTFEYNNFPENRYVPNIRTWFNKERIQEHRATFPIELPSYFINNFSKKWDIVFDPFMGSGTTAVACERLGRKWFGCELEPKYCAIAEERIKRERDQLKLF